MFNLRTTRRRATTHRLLILLALFALAGTACSDDGTLPIDLQPPSGDAAPEEPSASEETSEPAAEEPPDDAEAEEPADDAAADEPADDAEAVEPITADDVAEVCADEEARAATAEELAPIVGLSPETFESVACSSAE
jgi:hypothetical protein